MIFRKKVIRGTGFERKKLVRAIGRLKEQRAAVERVVTDPEEKKTKKEIWQEMAEDLTTAINAMETILYDL